MKKNILIKILGIVAFLSLFVTACDNAPKDNDAYIESSDLPNSSGEDIFAEKTFIAKDAYRNGFKYEFDNEGCVIFSEKNLSIVDAESYVKTTKYKYALTPKNEKKGYHYLRIHFKPIGYYIDDVLYTDSDEYVNKLITDIKNDSITVSDEYTEALKKIYKYQLTSTKFIRNYDYIPEDESENLKFTPDINTRNISNVLYDTGTNLSLQLKKRSFKTRLGVTSTKFAFVFTDDTEKECYKELDFYIYECTKNKAKVVCTYLDESNGGDDNSESSAEYKVAGYGKIKVDHKVEMDIIQNKYKTNEPSLFGKVKITEVDDNLKEYLTKELADITGTGEGFDVGDILDNEFQIYVPGGGCILDYHMGMLQ